MSFVRQRSLISDEICHQLQLFKTEVLQRIEGVPYDIERFLTAAIHEIDSPSLTVALLLERANIRSHAFQFRFRSQIRRLGWPPNSPKKTIEFLRVEAAKWIITATDADLGMIADALGYTYYETFWRAFYRAEGKSPSRFRDDLTDKRGVSVDHAMTGFGLRVPAPATSG